MILTHEQLEERKAYLQNRPSDLCIGGPLENAYIETIESAWAEIQRIASIQTERDELLVVRNNLCQQNTELLEDVAALQIERNEDIENARDEPAQQFSIPSYHQLVVNERWLLAQFDVLHDLLCPNYTGTWQMRVEQVVDAVKAMHHERVDMREGRI